ncbi:hypothetical protein FOHLNKBM_4569 [Methylobacterium longum]|nr:hypothetical protein FOHLNKBM_4569 [Methylobacterium longum]
MDRQLHQSGHPGQEQAVAIVGLQDHRVCDYILCHERRLADLPDHGLEPPARVGVHPEGGALPRRYAANIGLVHAGMDLHRGEVLGNVKRSSDLQARRQGLALVDEPADHDAVGRRADHRPIEVDLGAPEARLPLGHGGTGLRQLRFEAAHLRHGALYRKAVEVEHRAGLARLGLPGGEIGLCLLQGGGRGDLATAQGDLALEVALGGELLGLRALDLGLKHCLGAAGVVEVDPGPIEPGLLDLHVRHRHVERGAVLLDLGDETALVELGKGIPQPDPVVEVHVQLGDLPRELRADLHRIDRLHGAGGGNELL